MGDDAFAFDTGFAIESSGYPWIPYRNQLKYFTAHAESQLVRRHCRRRALLTDALVQREEKRIHAFV